MYPGPQHPRRIKVQREAPGLLSPQLHMVRMWQNPSSVLYLQSFSYRRRKRASQIHPCVAKRSVLLVQFLMQIPSGVGVSWDPRASPRAVSFRGWEITDENWPGWWVQEVVTNGFGHWQWVQDPCWNLPHLFQICFWCFVPSQYFSPLWTSLVSFKHGILGQGEPQLPLISGPSSTIYHLSVHFHSAG